MQLIIGNVIALVGSLFMVYSGVVKEKKKTLYVQSIQIALLAISNLVLNGISGFIINTINFIRNIICYKDALNFKIKILLSILLIGLTLYFNNLGFIGLLPLISALIFLWFMTVKDEIHFKIVLIISVVLWLIYDLGIQSYTASAFDIFTIIASSVSIIKIKGKKK